MIIFRKKRQKNANDKTLICNVAFIPGIKQEAAQN